MTDQQELLEQRIDETKASLVGKLEALETQVAEAVQTTTETVSGTVDAVKETVDTVREKVRNAGQFFNLKQRAEQNPWMVFGCSVAAGCLASYLLGGEAKRPAKPRQTMREMDAEPEAAPPEVSRSHVAAENQEKKHSWLRDQVGSLSGLAIGALMGVLRDAVASNLPEGLGKSVSQEVDRFTTQLGAKPITGPVISPPKQPAV